MQPYKKMYLFLFNKVSDAIGTLDAGEVGEARELLVSAQRQAEELYLSDQQLDDLFCLPAGDGRRRGE